MSAWNPDTDMEWNSSAGHYHCRFCKACVYFEKHDCPELPTGHRDAPAPTLRERLKWEPNVRPMPDGTVAIAARDYHDLLSQRYEAARVLTERAEENYGARMHAAFHTAWDAAREADTYAAAPWIAAEEQLYHAMIAHDRAAERADGSEASRVWNEGHCLRCGSQDTRGRSQGRGENGGLVFSAHCESCGERWVYTEYWRAERAEPEHPGHGDMGG